MKTLKKYAIISLMILITTACERTFEDQETINDPVIYNPDWSYDSHGNSIHNYLTVFPQDSVNTIEISMSSEDWNNIRTNMTSLLGFDFGSNRKEGLNFTDEDPEYIDISVTFNGKLWKNVGYRLKGNSSLSQLWRSGNYKLPFKLNFDKFENDYPAIEDQRFYGFKKLSFSPAFLDASLMREKLTPDIFRMAGIPAAQTAFYKVFVNFGSGLKYCGVYTAVEMPDDNLIYAEFGEEDGNLYKPESSFMYFDQDEFEKKNNESEANYSDVEEFITVLNSSMRTSNPGKWRAELENTFNIEHFIKYLAVNNAIVNWDTYGNMPHNFYLYNHSDKKLTWIPWDHNEALSGSPGINEMDNLGGGNPGGPGGGLPGGPGVPGGGLPGGENPGGLQGNDHSPLSLNMNEVSQNWPLINYLINDSVYFQKYKENMKWFNVEVFDQQKIHDLIDKYYQIIAPFAIGENGEVQGYTNLENDQSFVNGYNNLKQHISDRKTLISTYVP